MKNQSAAFLQAFLDVFALIGARRYEELGRRIGVMVRLMTGTTIGLSLRFTSITAIDDLLFSGVGM